MRIGVALAGAAVLSLCGCGASSPTHGAEHDVPTAARTAATASGGPVEVQVTTPASVIAAGGRVLEEYEAGRRDVARSGCLACHRIGASGNAGPGPNLTEVAGRLPREAIARTLVDPVAPMPSFRHLPPQKLRMIVAFLAQLK